MYAIKIRKTDLPLLALLNKGFEPALDKDTHYLIVNPDGANEMVTEKEFDEKFATRVSTAGPVLMKINKR